MIVTVGGPEAVPNVAVIVVVAASATAHVPVPLHPPPLHPENVDPASGTAVNVTVVPLVKLPEQLLPQLIPAGALVTVPLPAPTFSTVRPSAPARVAHAELEYEDVPVALNALTR